MVRVAIIGAGATSDGHIEGYLKFADQCQIVALADVDSEQAAKKAAEHGLKVANGIAELLAKEKFDAASVCLPPTAQSGAVIELLRSGKHVMVQNPMAASLEECDLMVASARAAGKLLSVLVANRFRTPVKKLKQVLDSGRLGKILHAQVDSFWWRGANYFDGAGRGTWNKEGGGCTMNNAADEIDLFQWIMGMPNEVRSVCANLAHENAEVEDFSTTVMSFPNGSVGQITASLVHHGQEQQLVFQCEKAKVALPWQIKASREMGNGFQEENLELVKEIQDFYDQVPVLENEGHSALIGNFLAAIDGREELLVDGEEGRKTIELITAIYQSGHLDQKVTLPLKATEPFYTRTGILDMVRHFHEKTRSVENFDANEITLGRQYGN